MIHSVALSLGNMLFELCYFIGSLSELFWSALKETFRKPFYPRLIIDQIYSLGIKSAPLVAVCEISTGMVITLQFGMGLEKFGGKLYVPKIVALSIIRELGPVFTSLMIAGRVGAGIASEIGSMKVTQQIDAIRALGTSPLKKIIIPRVIALIISLPLLTIFANTLGVYAASIIGSTELGLDQGFFIQKVAQTIKISDYTVGIVKTFFFALFVGLTGCHYGMKVSEGTRGVGIATTKSVVASSILIVVSDFVLTKLFWLIETL
jgi:phospholipid/cholesterol/gamma-HCH transport system permease protein